MRILVVAESFLPHMNGVTNSVLRVVDHFAASGDDLGIIAPKWPGADKHLRTSCGRRVRVRRIASAPMPGYTEVRIATTSAATLRRRIDEFAPDVIHLASPMILGGRAVVAAQKAGVPTVAVYQTDIPGYTARYGMPFLENASWQLLRDVHNRAILNLAPSTATRDQMLEHGIERVHLWRRGVDTSLFSPSLRSAKLRARYAEPEEKLVVYVGRLAPEKQVADLRVLHDMPGVRLLIVGDGPERDALRRDMPRARFAGFRSGTDLAAHLASADLFVHPGELETFGQTIQEAMASGLPVIAPRRGGPVDLVTPSRTGWLYTPGMLDELRDRAADLLFDDAKREAFGTAALESVRKRTWPVLSEQLRGYYRRAIEEHAGVPAR
ncbi:MULTISPECIES: glycosyltransferase family 4 protein [Brachybacterium]|uniref:D-inositol 3-phosphate glycosyltransferase n=2 Tax=Brachybacterium TaxID=43668 RepID=A0A426SP86_9MICO|nr:MULTISPECIES: glycosyltransferase family 1 protein [Brachybacterium]MCT1438038.1 glycosyltransferase family 1 protein [Brachybacterium paraconglomeratum]RRR19934.1 alpha-mannosyltransferase [Brachybacterium paraconglomeratum]GLI31774.1 glycosyl transferase [Brachybacterium conglomeratum]GLK03307.1 glycosyl transferase [Brachybacterium conglomeratum]